MEPLGAEYTGPLQGPSLQICFSFQQEWVLSHLGWTLGGTPLQKALAWFWWVYMERLALWGWGRSWKMWCSSWKNPEDLDAQIWIWTLALSPTRSLTILLNLPNVSESLLSHLSLSCHLGIVVLLLSRVQLSVASRDCSPPGSSAYGISRGKTLEWLPSPSPGNHPDSAIEPASTELQADSLPLSHGEAKHL